MAYKLSPLPYAYDALNPYMSTEMLNVHHDKHHRRHVDILNELIENTEFDDLPLEQLIRCAPPGPVVDHAAQVWNHAFFWRCLRPDGGGRPAGTLEEALTESFASVDRFLDEFTAAATLQFGSGWVWLIRDCDDSLSIASTSGANTPLVSGPYYPLLACDIWDHAYDIDYRNDKDTYLEGFWSLVDWEFVAANLARDRQPEWPTLRYARAPGCADFLATQRDHYADSASGGEQRDPRLHELH